VFICALQLPIVRNIFAMVPFLTSVYYYHVNQLANRKIRFVVYCWFIRGDGLLLFCLLCTIVWNCRGCSVWVARFEKPLVWKCLLLDFCFKMHNLHIAMDYEISRTNLFCYSIVLSNDLKTPLLLFSFDRFFSYFGCVVCPLSFLWPICFLSFDSVLFDLCVFLSKLVRRTF